MSISTPVVLIAGLVIIAATQIRQACLRVNVQPLVGFLLLGIALALVNQGTGFLTPRSIEQLDVLGQLGIVALLFKVGLNSDIIGLARQLRRALVIWAGDVTVSSSVGFIAAFYLLGHALVPSLFVAVAMSATSTGVSTAIWQEANLLDSDEGALLLDVAELDDISAILLMVLVFTAAPLLAEGQTAQLGAVLTVAVLAMLGKLAAFTGCVYLFARFAERRFTRYCLSQGVPTVAVTGMACLIAGVGAWAGFSVAIGALFAGLAFSRDPQEFRIDRQLEPVYELLSPFFFVSVGLGFQLELTVPVLLACTALLATAVAGKLIGAGGPTMLMLGWRRGWLIGLSMVPRAEIAMVVMLQGSRMGSHYVPQDLVDTMSLVVIATALLVPACLGRLLPVVKGTARESKQAAKIRR
jgi:Kef-type K+ transport system membrane component KefB